MGVAGKDGKEGENSGCDSVFGDAADTDADTGAAFAGIETEAVDPDDRELDEEGDRLCSAGLK